MDVTEFDKNEATEGTRVVYAFGEDHLPHPMRTIQTFVDDPPSFRDGDGDYRAILTEKQNARFLAYLRAGNYRYSDFTQDERPDYLLAFSYGENPDVNMQLATIVERAIDSSPDSLKFFVQWEIANILYERSENYRTIVSKIDLDYDREYITSFEVVEKFKRAIGRDKDVSVFLVSQAWHAPRCIQICRAQRLNIVRGEFIDDFSLSDPQKWVRNWLAWVLKEGTKK
jgi:hypothetical protein